MPVPGAVKESMERARWERSCVVIGNAPRLWEMRAARLGAIHNARKETRSILSDLRALRDAERVRLGVGRE